MVAEHAVDPGREEPRVLFGGLAAPGRIGADAKFGRQERVFVRKLCEWTSNPASWASATSRVVANRETGRGWPLS
jgi:hypothetical protein